MKPLYSIIIISLFTAGAAIARPVERWHQYAVRLDAGAVAVPADLNNIGPYSGKQLDGEMETRLSFLNILSPDMILSTSFSRLKSTAILSNTNPSYPLNYLNVDLDLMTLWLTLEYYPPRYQSHRTSLWYGGGLHAGVVELGYRERLYVSNSGYFNEERITRSTPLCGVHLAAGINIYPHEQSAICLTAEGRLNLTATGSDFDGSLISPAFLIGLRWDFGPNPD